MDYKYEVLERRVAYQRHFQLDELKIRHELFAGGYSRPLSRELFDRGDAVGVIPYDPKQDCVVMIEQFRPGAMARAHSPWLMEFVAGLVDTDESPEEVAHREAQEEAGLTLRRMEKVGAFFTSPGGSTEQLHLYCGLTDAPPHGSLHGLEDEGEDIKVHVIERGTAIELVERGTPLPSWTALGLYWLALNWERLQEIE